VAAAEVELTPDEMRRLDEVSAPPAADYPYGKPGVDQRHRPIEVCG
jgi:aryl-alcohol dehydrogenase (NADP+)